MAKPIVTIFKIKLSGTSNNFFFYFAVNTILIWLLARVPNFTGFGISRFTWAIILGLILNLIQWRSWEILKAQKLS
jgi:uncharacterized membrane protein YvlD (DUF360 family)